MQIACFPQPLFQGLVTIMLICYQTSVSDSQNVVNFSTDCIVFLLKNPSPSRTRIGALNFLSVTMSKSGNSGTTPRKGEKGQEVKGVNDTGSISRRNEDGDNNMLGEVLDAKRSPKG